MGGRAFGARKGAKGAWGLVNGWAGWRYAPGQGGCWGRFPFIVCDFRGGQEWMMYNHFGGCSSDFMREIGCYCG